MGDDSSDDEPIFSSPDPSDDESKDDDVFKFRARKFEMVQPSSPSPARGRRRKHVDIVKQKLALIEKKNETALRRFKEITEVEDSSSDEHDCKPKGTARKLGDDQVMAWQLTKHSDPHPESLESDSDDDVRPAGPMVLASLKGVSKEVLDTLKQSQMAARRLQAAQTYHAEDISVEQNSSPFNPPLQQVRLPPPNLQTTNHFKPGKILRLECRCQVKMNGKPQAIQQQRVSTNENQPLSYLMERVKMAFSLAADARVTMNYDGLLLDLRHTPATYEMESDDIVDVTATVVAMPKAPSSRVTLKLRHKVGGKVEETVMSHGVDEPFQILMDLYKTRYMAAGGNCSFRFDGETLSLHLTPARYEMENGELIDVVR
jgi:Ubiquitin-2 like Rad60 SUMO-like